LQKVITDDLNALIEILPVHISQILREQADVSELVEVIMDLGRSPEARFFNREIIITPLEISELDLEYTVSHVGSFGDDNRAGIERTLHRISAIRNRKGTVVGLTCRVGRAVYGTIQIIQDLVDSGKSVLLMGRPGVGKTTMLREMARVLADELHKRVVIVDTSNEIAGDGDIPHPGIGHARRMQVPTPSLQHAVMIEAVENHMPQVIVIDEIGTELEARAARTIAERGVQLIGTAHGNTLENLIINPTLADLIGGIQTVTLSDEEAKRRGTQKSILERMAPPTFSIVVEIQDRERVAIHPDVTEAVDSLLRGHPLETEVRWVDGNGEVHIAKEAPADPEKKALGKGKKAREEKKPKIYLFGVNRARLEQMAKDLQISLEIVNNPNSATIFVTSKAYYRNRPQKILDAEAANIPIYVLKSNTPNQIRQLLNSIYPSDNRRDPVTNNRRDPVTTAVEEAQLAVDQVRNGNSVVELSPQSAYIRRLQHLVAEQNELPSDSAGKEPNRHVRIYKQGARV
jgi:stage III sporulation protein SpoIIIAA